MQRKKRGSSIVIAILLVTAIGSIAFSFGRVLLMEISNASTYENGVNAYYSAESGIEEGFLRYRYQSNSEIPGTYALDNPKYFRTTLADNTVDKGLLDSGISKTMPNFSLAGKQIYDLRMGFVGIGKQTFYANDADNDGRLSVINDVANANYSSGENSYFNIKKDESLKFQLDSAFDWSGNDIVAHFAYPVAAQNDSMFIEAKATVRSPSGIIKEYKKMIRYDLNQNLGSAGNTDYINASFTGAGTKKYMTAASLLADLGVVYEVNQSITLMLKPLYYDVDFALSSSKCQNGFGIGGCEGTKVTVLPGPYTTINSTGYYGGVVRTLQAKIDRQSGSLYDLYDYVIYANTGSTNP